MRSRIGVVRAGSTTALDTLGIPTAVAVRKDVVLPSITVASGKGATPEHALTTAIAEAYERHAAEPRGRIATERGAFAVMQSAIDPESLVLAEWSRHERETAIEWCAGISLVTGERRFVPANAVFFPYEPPPDEQLFAAHTTGLAAGAAIEDALCHALLECIERDRYSHLVARLASGRQVDALGVDVANLDAEAAAIVERMVRAGSRVSVRDLGDEGGVPTMLAIIEKDGVVHRGVAARPDANAAAGDALLEAAQSRATDIQGAREDLRADEGPPHPWFTHRASGGRVPPSVAGGDVAADVRWLAGWCSRTMGSEPVAVDLSLGDGHMHAVRVVVPGAETWADDPDRLGPRGRRWIGKRP